MVGKKQWLPLGGMAKGLAGAGPEETFWGDGSTVICLLILVWVTCVYICINLEDMPLIFVGFKHMEIFGQKKKY